MDLNEILEVAKNKYPEAYIIDNYIIIEEQEALAYKKMIGILANEIHLESFQIEEDTYYRNTLATFKNNIIELRHYLNIEIEWEDLVKEFKENEKVIYTTDIMYWNYGQSEDEIIKSDDLRDNSYLTCFDIIFSIKKYIKSKNKIYHRSFWQMYQIIKNLTENEVKND